MAKPSGLIVYENKLIVLIAIIGKSSNRKTGNMIQTYILRRDRKPTEAIKDGSDSIICGNCPHRYNQETKRRTCYVNIGQGPNMVYKKYSQNGYPRFNPKIHSKYFTGRMLRIGSYGDPAVIPFRVWKYLLQFPKSHTGYTHQWEKADPRFKNIVMASCDNKADAIYAGILGYRTFTVTSHDTQLRPIQSINSIPCVSVTHGKQCEQCGLCNGNSKGMGKNIFIPAHGASKRFVLNLV